MLSAAVRPVCHPARSLNVLVARSVNSTMTKLRSPPLSSVGTSFVFRSASPCPSAVLPSSTETDVRTRRCRRSRSPCRRRPRRSPFRARSGALSSPSACRCRRPDRACHESLWTTRRRVVIGQVGVALAVVTFSCSNAGVASRERWCGGRVAWSSFGSTGQLSSSFRPCRRSRSPGRIRRRCRRSRHVRLVLVSSNSAVVVGVLDPVAVGVAVAGVAGSVAVRVASWPPFCVSGQLSLPSSTPSWSSSASHASPSVSASVLSWSELGVVGQLSTGSSIPSPSRSASHASPEPSLS